MKQIIVYSCVTSDVDSNQQVMRFSLSRDITSDPTKEAPRFKGRVAAAWTADEEDLIPDYPFWNSCRSGDQGCTSDGDDMVSMDDAEMLDWLLGVKHIVDELDYDGDTYKVLR